MSGTENWDFWRFVAEVVGFAGAIIVILIATHKISSKVGEMRADISNLKGYADRLDDILKYIERLFMGGAVRMADDVRKGIKGEERGKE